MIRVLISDDHRIYCQGVARLLGDHADLEVTATAGTHEETLDILRNQPIDVAIVDTWAQGAQVEGAFIAQIKEVQHSTRVLMIVMENGDFSPVRALRAGADGFLTKESSAEDVVAAVRQVATGARYVSPAAAERLAFALAQDTGNAPHESLSEREFRVFLMIVEGMRGAQIASELNLSEKTVSTHKAHIMRKLSAKSASDLVRYAIRHNIDRMQIV